MFTRERINYIFAFLIPFLICGILKKIKLITNIYTEFILISIIYGTIYLIILLIKREYFVILGIEKLKIGGKQNEKSNNLWNF